MAQFYTLEEAARVLGMDPEELKAKAQHREVRAFMDSGSWRFRVADIDELARRRGMGKCTGGQDGVLLRPMPWWWPIVRPLADAAALGLGIYWGVAIHRLIRNTRNIPTARAGLAARPSGNPGEPSVCVNISANQSLQPESMPVDCTLLSAFGFPGPPVNRLFTPLP